MNDSIHDARVSPTQVRPRIPPLWLIILAGPVVGTTYFWIVCLLAEAACADELELVGTTALRIVILAGAAASVATLTAVAWRAGRAARQPLDDEEDTADLRENRRFIADTSLVLLGLFVLFALFLAAPAIGTSLC